MATEILPRGFEGLKPYIEAIVRRMLTEGDAQDASRSMALPARIESNIRRSVVQLTSVDSEGSEENCGTMIFVKKDMAITCFHSVYRKSRILEASLRAEGSSLHHICSFPYYDISVYECRGREGPSLDLDTVGSLGVGGQFYFAFYPSIAESEDNYSSLVICTGSVCCIEDVTRLGQYECFPGSSGGAIVSSSGQLMGMHLESVYHEDESLRNPPDWYDNCRPEEIIRTLEWGRDMIEPVDFWETADTQDLAVFAARNIGSKGHLGRFQPASIIRTKLLEAGLLPARRKKRQKIG